MKVHQGKYVNAKTLDNGSTPLHIAARHFLDQDAVRLLLSAGADVNAKTSDDGSTPLHVAARYFSHQSAVQLLVHASADVNALNDKNQTSFAGAWSYSQNKIAQWPGHTLDVGAFFSIPERKPAAS